MATVYMNNRPKRTPAYKFGARKIKSTKCVRDPVITTLRNRTKTFQLDMKKQSELQIGRRFILGHHGRPQKFPQALESGKHVFLKKPLDLTLLNLTNMTNVKHQITNLESDL